GQTSEPARDLRFANSSGPDHDDVLGHDFFRQIGRKFLAAHPIAQGNRDRPLRFMLADHILVQFRNDFLWCQFIQSNLGFFRGSWQIDSHLRLLSLRSKPLNGRARDCNSMLLQQPDSARGRIRPALSNYRLLSLRSKPLNGRARDCNSMLLQQPDSARGRIRPALSNYRLLSLRSKPLNGRARGCNSMLLQQPDSARGRLRPASFKAAVTSPLFV